MTGDRDLRPAGIDLASAFARFSEPWSPRLLAEFNGQSIKLARLRGEFVWHKHDDADEVFLVHRGRLVMHLRDGAEASGAAVERSVELTEGQLLVVPRGVEHKPVAPDEALVVLLEPAALVNTGDVRCDLTRDAEPL